jgi:hypothetical protein
MQRVNWGLFSAICTKAVVISLRRWHLEGSPEETLPPNPFASKKLLNGKRNWKSQFW